MIAHHLDRRVQLLRAVMQACWLSAVVASSPAVGQEAPGSGPEPAPPIAMNGPRVTEAEVDWNAAGVALAGRDPESGDTVQAGAAAAATTPAPPAADAWTQLNAATEKLFPNIATSAVPVLLPLDRAGLLRDQADGTQAAGTIPVSGKYLSGFVPAWFLAGPSGYDAILTLPHQHSPDLTFAKPVSVQITGSSLLYDLDGPAVPDGAPVPEFDGKFPGIRRVLLESHVRYTFLRFGVAYFVSILCFDGPRAVRRLSCREADKVAIRFLAALDLAGGAPQPAATAAAAPAAIERPEPMSPDFSYYAPGDLIPGTGMKGQSGRADATVYARIRFPMAQAPAYTNSQSFMNWGDCNFTGRVGLGGTGRNAAYHCKVNDRPLVKDESQNYAYPWRDNFCEHRSYYVSQCPAGLGHQGEDIRPGTCLFRTGGAGRCAPYQNDAVAVRDGVLMRAPGDKALYLVVDRPGEHMRFRYLHLDPTMLDAAGMVNGREVSEGEVIGAVATYEKQLGGTSYHLHFDVQVPTRQGWVFVNPYLTLVTAYERLIGGRGEMVKDPEPPPAPAAAATPAEDGAQVPGAAVTPPPNIATPSKSAATDASVPRTVRTDSVRDSRNAESNHRRDRTTLAAEHCQTRFAEGRRRRACGIDVARARPHERHAHAVRSVDRDVSRHGRSARHYDGDLRTRHARGPSRHNRA